MSVKLTLVLLLALKPLVLLLVVSFLPASGEALLVVATLVIAARGGRAVAPANTT